MTHAMIYEGAFLRQHGKGYAARVTVSMQPTAALPGIRLACTGRLAQAQGELEEATRDGYADWKAGAVVGIQFALACTQHTAWEVTVTRIVGLTTDTNPTIVAVAAMRAVAYRGVCAVRG